MATDSGTGGGGSAKKKLAKSLVKVMPPNTGKFLRNHSVPEREDTRDNPAGWHRYGPGAAMASGEAAWMAGHPRPGGGSKVQPMMTQQGGQPPTNAENIRSKIEQLLYRTVAPPVITAGRVARTGMQAYNAVPGVRTGNPTVDNLANNTVLGSPAARLARAIAAAQAQLAQERGRGLNAPPYAR